MHYKQQWTTVINSKESWLKVNFRDLWNYRDLIFLLVRRDFVSSYKQTIFGPFWAILQPLFSTILYTFLFGQIARISTNGIPQILFYMSGVVVWNFLIGSLNKISTTFVSNAGLFGKVYFPRLTIPIASIFTNLITFAIQFVMFLIFLLFYYFNGHQMNFNIYVLLLPVLLLQIAFLSLGIGTLISSLTIKYRDVIMFTGFIFQLWMYATPVLYPISMVPTSWQWVYKYNPMSSVIDIFRLGFFGVGSFDITAFLYTLIISIILMIAGFLVFNKVEKNFMDTV